MCTRVRHRNVLWSAAHLNRNCTRTKPTTHIPTALHRRKQGLRRTPLGPLPMNSRLGSRCPGSYSRGNIGSSRIDMSLKLRRRCGVARGAVRCTAVQRRAARRVAAMLPSTGGLLAQHVLLSPSISFRAASAACVEEVAASAAEIHAADVLNGGARVALVRRHPIEHRLWFGGGVGWQCGPYVGRACANRSRKPSHTSLYSRRRALRLAALCIRYIVWHCA